MKYDKLGERMKRYEAVAQTTLMRRTPVILRVDMKAGHTFCKHLKRPYDVIFHAAMVNTMIRMCKNIQNATWGYCQSDEISIVLFDHQTLTTDAWFNNEIPKLCSITASMATLYFNQEFTRLAEQEVWEYRNSLIPQSIKLQEEIKKYHNVLRECIQMGAMFDARCFNVPFEEVINYFYYRQQDAIRNSIQSYGQYYFSQKELYKKNSKEIIEMLKEKGIYWETMPICTQRGVCCYKNDNGWKLDMDMPMLKGDGRKYLEGLMPSNE